MTDSSDKPRGLWAVMKADADASGNAAGDAGEPAGGQDASPRNDDADNEAERPAKREAAAEPKPKGLWSVMRNADEAAGAPESPIVGSAQASGAPAAAKSDAVSQEAEEPPGGDDSRPLKGLWGVMSGGNAARASRAAESGGAAAIEAPPATGMPPESEADEFYLGRPADDEPGSGMASGTAVEGSVVPGGKLAEMPFAAVATAPAFTQVGVASHRSSKALAACLVGVCALPLSALALLPEVWLRFPATILGFAALVLGLLGWQEVRGARGRPGSDPGDSGNSLGAFRLGSSRTGRELAGVGMVLGVLAMFLGPVVFARLGQGYRKSSGREETIANLEAIGRGVLEHHREHGRYPPGGSFRVEEDGSQRPMHGWMAALLPYLGQQDLYRSIDFEKPYDDPANLPAVRQEVAVFFAAGADRRPVGRLHLAPAHFAGVGGQLSLEGTGLVELGVFGRGSDVSSEDVTDGLSQTLIAGEISHFFPAWGEPENWRAIGRGLNREPNGFGNADGTGALFLKADGSVRFYANDTAIDVLQKLSTRNAADVVPEQYR